MDRLKARLFNVFLMIMMAIFAGCSSPPDGTTAENLLRSGSAASSSAKSGDISTPVAGAYMGDATNAPITAQADRTTSSTSTVTQMAFDFAGTVSATGEAYEKMVQADPLLQALGGQLARADLTPEERTALLAQMQARLDAIQGSLRSAGGDLSALSSLTVINTATHAGNAGHSTTPLTPEEASAAATGIPKVIEAARSK